MTYTITFKRQLTYLTQPLLFEVIFLILSYFTIGFTRGLFVVPVIFFTIDLLPTLILHFQYLDENFKAKLSVDRVHNQMTYRQGKYYLSYHFQDIEKITKVHSSTSGFTNARHSFTNYFYYKFLFKDGVELNVTCLLADDLEVIFSLIYDKKMDTAFKIFPSV